MAMTSSPSRLSLKAELLQRIQCLDRADALLPSHHPDIDDLITELEALTPIQQPLLASHFSTLLGSWELIYASRGTVVTRRMEDLINLPIGIRRVWQRLTLPPKARLPSPPKMVLSSPFLWWASSLRSPRAFGNPTQRPKVPRLALGPLVCNRHGC